MMHSAASQGRQTPGLATSGHVAQILSNLILSTNLKSSCDGLDVWQRKRIQKSSHLPHEHKNLSLDFWNQWVWKLNYNSSSRKLETSWLVQLQYQGVLAFIEKPFLSEFGGEPPRNSQHQHLTYTAHTLTHKHTDTHTKTHTHIHWCGRSFCICVAFIG